MENTDKKELRELLGDDLAEQVIKKLSENDTPPSADDYDNDGEIEIIAFKIGTDGLHTAAACRGNSEFIKDFELEEWYKETEEAVASTLAEQTRRLHAILDKNPKFTSLAIGFALHKKLREMFGGKE